MKSIKNIALGAFLFVAGLGSVVYTSCNKDKCKDVVCQNGGTCNEGDCVCTTGYEGSNCETLSRAKFLKTWSANDQVTGSTTPIPYSSTVVAGASSSVTAVVIGNFSDFFLGTVNATVSGNTITISTQNPDGNHYQVSGSGTLANNKITWSYTIKHDSTNVTDTYTGTWQ